MVDMDEDLNRSMMREMDDRQKTVFLKTLLFASKIDGKVEDSEIKYIKKMASKYKVSDIKKIFEPTMEADLFFELKCLNERGWLLELIKELFRLAHSDDDLGDAEVLFIGRLGKALNIETEKVEQISNWVVDYLVWREQGKIIFEENE